jgi:hypothetical protein
MRYDNTVTSAIQRRDAFGEFLAKRSQCYDLAERIMSTLDLHLGIAPGDIDWCYVTDVEGAMKCLSAAAYLLRVRPTTRPKTG